MSFTKTYTIFDAINEVFIAAPVVGAFLQTNVDAVTTIIAQTPALQESSSGGWEITLNLSSSSSAVSGVPAQCVWGGDYAFNNQLVIEQTWEIDYAAVLGIPSTAKIKKLVFRRPRIANVQFNATAVAGGNREHLLLYEDAINTPIYFTFVDITPFVSPATINESITGSAADEVIFDYTGGPTFITRAQLIASYSEFNNNLYGVSVFSSSDSDGLSPVSSLLTGTISVGVDWEVTVTYDLTLQWDILSQSTSPIDSDDADHNTITITSDPDSMTPPPLDMEEILTIDIYFEDPGNPGNFITINVPELSWTLITTNLLTFTMPSFGAYEPTTFNILITGTQFTGTLDLGSLWTIWFTSASGMYTLTLGKTNDTLYLEEDLPNTIDVKIPNPTIKTGYVGG